MKQNTVIISNWSKEQQKVKEQAKLNKLNRYAYYMEFKESICDLFDRNDFIYYSEQTGLKIETLRRMAKYSQKHLEYMNDFWSQQAVTERQVLRTLFSN